MIKEMMNGDKKRHEPQKTLCSRIFPADYRTECKRQLKLAWPLMLTQLCQIALQPVSVIFGGHLGKTELDAVVLANTLINVFGNSLLIGMNTACDTFFAQAYGNRKYGLIGVILQRSFYIHMLVLLLLVPLYLNMEPILVSLGQDPKVSRMTQIYMEIFLPGLFFLFMYTILRKYLACQNIVNPTMIIAILGIGVDVIFQYINLYILEWGVKGSSIAQAYGCAFMFLGTFGYILVSGTYRSTWQGVKWESLREWGPFTKLVIYGILMVGLEWWAFEVFVFLTGLLGTSQLGAQGVIINWDMIIFALAFGLADASAICVGQSLGAGKPEVASRVARVGLFLTTILSLIEAALFIGLRYQLPLVFTNSPQVIELAVEALPYLAGYAIITGIGQVCRGVFRGCGMQIQATAVVTISYYFLALPLGIPLMFLTPLKFLGSWLALLVALTLAGIGLTIYVLFYLDYNKAVNEAKDRTKEENPPSEPPHKQQGNANIDEKTELLAEPTLENERSRRAVLLKRMAILSVVLLILLAGVLCRLLVPEPLNHTTHQNMTLHTVY